MPTPHEKSNHDGQGHDPTQRSQVPPPQLHAAHIVPPQLPPETYTYLIHALLSLQGSSYPHSYPPSFPSYDLPWPSSTASPISSAPMAGPSSFYPTSSMIPFPPHAVPQSTSSAQHLPTAAAAAAQDPEDAMSTTEDKRRRNTAASARFRVKRKMKTLSLERSVADLTGRTEDLEREANDLRRENAWLKEIVLLKGRNLAVSSHGSGIPMPSNRHSEDEDDRTHAESTVKRGGKGKDKETDPGNA